jgi:hypothetical protein
MNFDKTYKKILENMGQDIMSNHMAGQRQLIHNILKDPKKLLQLIYRAPGMHADLVAGRMDLLAQKFKTHFGVDYEQIANQVQSARNLLNKEKMGHHVPIKKAMPVTENVNMDRIMDYFFEDLYNIRDDRELLNKIRERVETQPIQHQLGTAFTGDLVERVFTYIRSRRTKDV